MKDAAPTKTKLQATALRLFVENGVEETTTRDLAAAAGIAEGTIYRHYASKDDLISELFATNYAAYGQRLDELQQRARGFRAKLAAMVADICSLYDTDPLRFRFLLIVQHRALPRIATEPWHPVNVIERVMREAIASGEVGVTNPMIATATLFGLVLQPAVFLVYGRLEPPMSLYSSEIVAMCERALLVVGTRQKGRARTSLSPP